MNFIFDPSLVLYLPLHELAGSSFMSRDAYGHLCTVTGALWRPDGRYFDGSDDKIDCGASSVFNFGTGDFTLEAWAKTNSATGGDETDGVLLEKYIYPAGYAVNIGDTSNKGKVRFWVYNGGYQVNLLSTRTVDDGNAHHIVAVRDGTTQLVYIDGNLDNSGAGELRNVDSTGHVTIGYEEYHNFRYFYQLIGEIRVYRRALVPTEIQHNYQTTKWRYR